MDEGIDLHHVQHLVSLSSLAYKDDIIDDQPYRTAESKVTMESVATEMQAIDFKVLENEIDASLASSRLSF